MWLTELVGWTITLPRSPPHDNRVIQPNSYEQLVLTRESHSVQMKHFTNEEAESDRVGFVPKGTEQVSDVPALEGGG